jgi:hypothetical protein
VFDMADADDTFNLKFMRGQPRDPERINQILAAIGEVWHAHPDMRLAQLVVNLLDPKPNAMFYIEDDVLAERLREFNATARWPTSS